MKKKTKKNDRKSHLLFESGEGETRILKRENKRFWKILGIACVLILLIFLIASLIDIYELCAKLHPYFGIGAVAFLILLLIIFVLRPIVVALSTPCFTLDIAEGKSKAEISRKNYRKLKRVAKNIIHTNENVSEESKKAIEKAIGDKRQLNAVLKRIYDTEINADINRLIRKKASEVLIATAISQNNKFDAATTIVLNIRLIMQIVVRCGYHPSYPQLSKLIVKVMRNAMIAYTVQSLNLEEIVVSGIDKLVKGTLSAIPGLNEISKSLTQGAANALLTLRIGILTRKYLYEEYDIQASIGNLEEIDNEILVSACTEANENIDEIVNECRKNKQKVSV